MMCYLQPISFTEAQVEQQVAQFQSLRCRVHFYHDDSISLLDNVSSLE